MNIIRANTADGGDIKVSTRADGKLTVQRGMREWIAVSVDEAVKLADLLVDLSEQT